MSQKFDLSGKWEFSCRNEARFPGDPCPAEYPGAMLIPGYWDDHYELFDYSSDFDRTAKFNPEYRPIHFPMGEVPPDASMPFIVGSGYYRKRIQLHGVAGRKISIHVGAAVWGSEVFCNGKSAGFHTGYSTGMDYPLDGLLVEGENEIIIAVSNCRQGGARDTHNGQHRGLGVRGFKSTRAGIGEGVWLNIGESAVISDRCIALNGAELEFRADISGSGAETLELVVDAKGETLFNSVIAVPENGEIRQKFPVPAGLPRWSDRDPQLCRMTLTLKDGKNTVLDSTVDECGFADFSTSGYKVTVNGIATYMRGSTEHCYFPESCNPHWDTEKYFADLGVLKSAGFNFMRCHTWCPPEPFFIACDRLGLIAQVEVPPRTGTEEWDAILKMIRRHVSAAILCGGNEENLTDERIEGLRQLKYRKDALAPWMLFNPHEALALVEYRINTQKGLPPGEEKPEDISDEPFPHNKRKLADLAEFSDVYGTFVWGFASYGSDVFPGSGELERRLAIYKKPCLAHEAGILGGYLNPDLEPRYENTYIGTTLYATSRKYMEKHGVSLADFRRYYQLNSYYVADLRKQLLENLRSSPSLGGYDFLGGQDAHWHRCGYPCGVFNEFYEEKPGETAASFRRCNGESVLLCDAGYQRNFQERSRFHTAISISYYGAAELKQAVLHWEFKMDGFYRSGDIPVAGVSCGTVTALGEVSVDLPAMEKGRKAELSCVFTTGDVTVCNQWDFWCFPAPEKDFDREKVRVVTSLSEADVEFVRGGGNLLMLDGFPCDRAEEAYRPCSTGRVAGHYGSYVKAHPALKNFPNDGYLTWQGYNMIQESRSMYFREDALLPFAPIIGLIPAYKLCRNKAMLTEYKFGKGRIMMCAFNIKENDPGALYLKSELLRYLSGNEYSVTAPEISDSCVKQLLKGEFSNIQLVETDIACDPNVQ